MPTGWLPDGLRVASGWPRGSLSGAAKRQTQEVGTGWPDFDPDFAEEPILKALRHLSLIVPPFKNRFVPSALAFKALSFALKQVWCIVARA